MKTRMRLLTVTAMLAVVAGMAGADRLVLKNGSSVQGAYLGGSPRQVRFDVNGSVQTYEIDQVRSISFSEEIYTQSPPPPPPPPGEYRDGLAPRQGNARQDNARQDYPRQDNQQGNYGSMGVTLPSDTSITIRMIDAVNSETARLGQTFRATIDEPVTIDGRQVIPRGADVMTKLVDDQRSGKLAGRTVLTMALVSINVDGRVVDVDSTDVRTASGSRTARTAGVVGGGAAVGAIIGALAGGGKGAAIGAASGGALGGATEIFTSGQKVKIPSETRLTFRLQAPVRL
jgi:hypothetical protein